MTRPLQVRIASLILIACLLGAVAAQAGSPKVVRGGVEFTLPDQGAFKVYWAGDHNSWSATATPFIKDDEGIWRVVVPLGTGEHEYKFIVDGNWIADPDNPRTHGEYGNSFVKINPDGKIDAGGAARLPSALNPKLYIGGLYYANYKLEARESESERVLLERPEHDINLRFDIDLNSALKGTAEFNINNTDEGADMWRTHLNLQRAALDYRGESFRLKLFENQGVFVSDDPLQLVGRVGTYDYPYGYDTRGALLKSSLPLNLDLTALVADAGLSNPSRQDISTVSPPAEDSLAVKTYYGYGDEEGYRDDIMVQLGRDLFGDNRLTYMAWTTRGLKPGYLYVQTIDWADSSDTGYYYRTVQNNLLHSLSCRRSWSDKLTTEAQLFFGEATLQAKDLNYERLDGEFYSETLPGTKSWTIQKTLGLFFSVKKGFGKYLDLGSEFHYQRDTNKYDHLNIATPDQLPDADIQSRMRRYALNLLYHRGLFIYSLDLQQENFIFDPLLGWGDHFWFAGGEVGAGNIGLIENDLPLAKYGLIGYRSASLIKQELRLDFDNGAEGGLEVAFLNQISSTRLDRKPMFWDLEMEWLLKPWQHWSLLYNHRLASYDHDFLHLNKTFYNNFVELTYHIGSMAEFSLGYGVDPYILDPVSKSMMHIGRREYLVEQGVTEEMLHGNFRTLGSSLSQAEEEMQQIKRISLEGRFVF